MRNIITILLILIPSQFLAQDTMHQTDSLFNSFKEVAPDSVIGDSVIFESTIPIIQKEKKEKKVIRKAKKEKSVELIQNTNPEEKAEGDESYGFLLIGAVILISIFISALLQNIFISKDRPRVSNSDTEKYISDQLDRMFMSRRNYYRNVYLKSEAWKRKRFVVLKRDNWKCQFCGNNATQVHHKRYAKRNIGKEPIEWLVSVCKSCHDAQH